MAGCRLWQVLFTCYYVLPVCYSAGEFGPKGLSCSARAAAVFFHTLQWPFTLFKISKMVNHVEVTEEEILQKIKRV